MSAQCRPYGSYIVIVAEKPKAAEKIAHALGRPAKCRYSGVPYWVLWNGGERVFIVPSAGHLFGPHSSKRGFPVYEMDWRPLFEFDKTARFTYKFYKLMEYILPGAKFYINACDYDIEGSVIGYTIIEWFGDTKRYARMKFSSLSPIELKKAYSNLDLPDTLLVEAGKARHEVDWLWGINVSRALMHAVRTSTGQRVILSAGRVQSPTIVEAARRWIEINLSVPIPVFSLTLTLEYEGRKFQAHPYRWRPETLPEAREIASRLRREKVLTVKDTEESLERPRPPPAFNLGDLQREASRLFGFSPMKTQKIAEDLYLEALISYPRTNSQKLPLTIDYMSVLRGLAKLRAFDPLIKRLLDETRGVLRPVQGPKEDPAHPAIHPTGEVPRGELDRDHAIIYELIVRRFLAAFSRPAMIARMNLYLRDREGRMYAASGVTVRDEGWFAYYTYSRPEERWVPALERGILVEIDGVRVEKSWQRRAPKLSRTSLLVWMERERIGTEATRARIIETLFRRGYLESRGGKTVVTDLGMMVASVIEELFPDLSRTDLTRSLESMLEDVQNGKLTRRHVVERTMEEVDRLLAKYRERLDEVGDKLAYSLGLKEPPRRCPICGRLSSDESSEGLCSYHLEAVRRLERAAPDIARRLGLSSVEEALRTISRLRGQAGKWVVEAASYVLGR